MIGVVPSNRLPTDASTVDLEPASQSSVCMLSSVHVVTVPDARRSIALEMAPDNSCSTATLVCARSTRDLDN